MLRPVALLALLGLAATPRGGSAEEMYSFVDRDGIIHVTNVPQDPRFRRMRGSIREVGGIHHITLRSRAPRPRDSGRYDEHIVSAAEKYGLPTPLLKAVMAVESNFNPSAVSGKGATGLMQLMPGTARDMYVLDSYDPAQNIEGGARYLRYLHGLFGNDLRKVLAAYNAGPEVVRRFGGEVPPIPETQAYVRKVMKLYEAYLKGH